MRRVIIAAISSGSGKTTITCGLLQALKEKGLQVQAYKCGPDYIDPMFHKKVLGIPSENLDLFFSTQSYITNILQKNKNADIAVIEGAMGIYDGIMGRNKDGSVYELAKKTDTPIVLLVDAKGMGNTLLSVIKGILLDDTEGLIKAVVFNRISAQFYESIAPLVEAETRLKVLGFVGKLNAVSIDSRHLGLKLPTEIETLEEQIGCVSRELAGHVDLDKILEIAEEAGDLDVFESSTPEMELNEKKSVRLAVAMDEAFCFYYEDNFRVLEEAGASLVFFSPLHDETLPENIDGILLGGGYPELKCKELEANTKMRQSIKKIVEDGIPCIAECGGFMYLHDVIETEEGSFSMVGAVSGKCYNTGKLCRFGYVDLAVSNYQMKGHEFHYYDSTNCGEDGVAVKPGKQKQWKFGFFSEGRLWGFPHIYYGSCPDFIKDFIAAVAEYREKNNHGE